MQINPAQLGQVRPLVGGVRSEAEQLAGARKLKEAYTDFVGKTFFGQMLKAMRSTVDTPAYFHGGRTEEAFQSQLDHQMADAMSAASASQLADPMFERQFPREAQLLANAERQNRPSMAELIDLRRR